MRTQADIVEHIKAESKADVFGFGADALLGFLDYEHAKPFLKPEATAEEWSKHVVPLTRDRVLAEMRDYMEFAWGKALNHRDISASRSVIKMQAWLWLLREEDLLKFASSDYNYPNYGAPILAEICRRLDFPIPDDDAARRMAEGERCSDDCDQGCSR